MVGHKELVRVGCSLFYVYVKVSVLCESVMDGICVLCSHYYIPPINFVHLPLAALTAMICFGILLYKLLTLYRSYTSPTILKMFS
jgi:hypothetical protein